MDKHKIVYFIHICYWMTYKQCTCYTAILVAFVVMLCARFDTAVYYVFFLIFANRKRIYDEIKKKVCFLQSTV